jgi:hypothetical protein
MFRDRQGILLVEFLPRDMTINAAAYFETLNKLRCATQNKRRDMLSAKVVYLQDNTHPHAAAGTYQLLASIKWELVDHPLYRLSSVPVSGDLLPANISTAMMSGRRAFRNGSRLFGSPLL